MIFVKNVISVYRKCLLELPIFSAVKNELANCWYEDKLKSIIVISWEEWQLIFLWSKAKQMTFEKIVFWWLFDKKKLQETRLKAELSNKETYEISIWQSWCISLVMIRSLCYILSVKAIESLTSLRDHSVIDKDKEQEKRLKIWLSNKEKIKII